MANREFKIQSDTISLNGVPLSSSFDGKVVLPGVTRATGYVVKEVDEVDGNEVNTSFNAQTVIVIDNAQYSFYAGLATPSPQYLAAQYGVQLEDDGKLDEIDVDVPGLYSNADRSLALGGSMWITDVAGAVDNFNINDWVQIPFLPKFQAGAVESDLGGSGGNTGSITFEGVSIIGAGTASGDGAGYGTLELVPDENLYEGNQYLVVDPTGPNHIHIRAGGTQDSSTADLYVGGEKNYVRASDSSGVRLQNERLAENFYYYSDPTFTSGSWYEENGNFYLDFTTTDPAMINNFWEFTNGGQNRVIVNQNDTLEYGGSASTPAPDVYRLQVLTGPVTSPWAVNTIEFQLFVIQTNSLILENNDFRVDVYDDIRMFGRDIFRFVNYSVEEPIEITTNYNNNSQTWAFQPNGTLVFPDGSTQSTAFTGGSFTESDTLDSVTDRGATTTNNITVGAVLTTDITNKLSAAVGTQVAGIRPPDGSGANNGYVWVPDETQISSLGDITGWTLTNSDGIFTTTVVQMRNDIGAAWAIETADALIYTGTYTFTSPDYQAPQPLPVSVNVDDNTWTFGTNGYLTFPNNGVIRVDGNNLEVGGLTNFNVEAAGVVNIYTDTDGVTPYQWQFGDDGSLTLPNDGVISAGGSGGLTLGGNFDVKIVVDYTDNNRTWTFEGTDGSITFPDNTVQETAWAGGRVVSVPAHSYGAIGDQTGDLAFSNGYIYYCTADFATHETAITVNSDQWGGTAGGITSLPFSSVRAPQVGWTINITFNSGPATLTITNVTPLGDDRYQVDFNSVGDINVSNGNTGTLVDDLPVADIWKRVAWSGDTW